MSLSSVSEETRMAAARNRSRRRSGMLNVLVLSSIVREAAAIWLLRAAISDLEEKLGEFC